MRQGNGRIIVIHPFVLFDKMADYISSIWQLKPVNAISISIWIEYLAFLLVGK